MAATERTPLLGHDSQQDEQSRPPSPSASTTSSNQSAAAALQISLDRQNAFILSIVLIILIELGAYLQVAPVNALMEDIICHKTYHTPSLPGCKSPHVQSRLAMLRGWQVSFDAIPALLTSIPYGMLSDRAGRRPVLFLSLLGVTLNTTWTLLVLLVLSFRPDSPVPLEAVWAGSLFTFVGGGTTTLTSMIFTIIADVVPAEDTTSAFLTLGATSLTGDIIATPLSGMLMKWKGPWLPCFLGIGFLCLCVATAVVLPETLETRKRMGMSERDSGRRSDDEETACEEGDCQEGEADARRKKGFFKEVLDKATRSVAGSWTQVLWNRSILLLLFPIIFTTLGRHVGELTLQYATKRYNWNWSDATFLVSFKSLWTLAFYILVLPGAERLCTVKFEMTPLCKDLLIARISGVVLVMGAFMVAFSVTPAMLLPSLVFFSFGSGFTFPLRSLLNALVEDHFIGTMNSIIGFLENIGVIIAVPWLSFLLSTGIKWGGTWIGLPFMGAGAMFMVAVGFVATYRLPPSEIC